MSTTAPAGAPCLAQALGLRACSHVRRRSLFFPWKEQAKHPTPELALRAAVCFWNS